MKTGKFRKVSRNKTIEDKWVEHIQKMQPYWINQFFRPNTLLKYLTEHKSKHTKRKISRGYVVARKLEGDTVSLGGSLDASPASSK